MDIKYRVCAVIITSKYGTRFDRSCLFPCNLQLKTSVKGLHVATDWVNALLDTVVFNSMLGKYINGGV